MECSDKIFIRGSENAAYIEIRHGDKVFKFPACRIYQPKMDDVVDDLLVWLNGLEVDVMERRM